jgi:hypothetical protein
MKKFEILNLKMRIKINNKDDLFFHDLVWKTIAIIYNLFGLIRKK